MAGNLIMGERETYGPFGYSILEIKKFTSLTIQFNLVPKS